MRQYTSLKEIAHDLVRDVDQAGGDVANHPWKLPEATLTAASALPAASAPLAASAPRIAEAAPPDRPLDLQRFEAAFGAEELQHGGHGHVVPVIGADGAVATPGQLADSDEVSTAEDDIVVKSNELLKFEHHSYAVTSYITSVAKYVLAHTFRLYQPTVSVDLKIMADKGGTCIFAAKEYQKGTLHLVPYSTIIFDAASAGFELSLIHI